MEGNSINCKSRLARKSSRILCPLKVVFCRTSLTNEGIPRDHTVVESLKSFPFKPAMNFKRKTPFKQPRSAQGASLTSVRVW